MGERAERSRHDHDDSARRASVHAALAAPSRADLLERLRASGEALDVDRLAERTGLHRTTVRFHLDVLVDAGLATRQPLASGHPGRPRLGYQAVAGGPEDGSADYRVLAEALTGYLASGASGAVGGGNAGREAGRLLGRRLGHPFGSARTSARAVARHVDATFNDLGFGSRLTRRRDGYHLALHTCPFRDLAVQHRDVVCGMHAGLLEQAAVDIDSPVTSASLSPFVEPHLCVARLSTARSTAAPAGSA